MLKVRLPLYRQLCTYEYASSAESESLSTLTMTLEEITLYFSECLLLLHSASSLEKE